MIVFSAWPGRGGDTLGHGRAKVDRTAKERVTAADGRTQGRTEYVRWTGKDGHLDQITRTTPCNWLVVYHQQSVG